MANKTYGLAGLTLADTPEVKTQANALAECERGGALARSYQLIRGLTKTEAQAVAVAAGHSVLPTTDRGFWQDLQAQIAEACRQRCDGYELRARRAS